MIDTLFSILDAPGTNTTKKGVCIMIFLGKY